VYEVQLLIDGADRPARDGAKFTRDNPVSGKAASVAADATVEDALLAVDAAARALPGWSQLGPSARRALLQSAARLLRERAPQVAECIVAETGETMGWGMFNVHLAAGMLEEAAALTTQVAGEVIPSDHPGTLAMGVRKPAGVVLGMAPWNAPIILGVRAVATPLACGNTVVLKASETCPATHRMIGEVLTEAGLPPGVLNVLTHSAARAPELVAALIAAPAVRRVNFTGSTRVGRIVGELCGRHLKPAVLELGGKAPMVVLDDADLPRAVDAAIFGCFMNQGQICMSTERLIVDESVADAFVEAFAARASALRWGAPAEGHAPLGAVVDRATVERLKVLVDDAVARGARLVAGGTGDGVFFAPTVLDHVTPEMKLFREESFGPVVGVTRVRGVDEAVRLANDTEYGLSAAVFGRDVERALQVADRIDAGMVHVNSPTVQDEPQMPFGGTKASGLGRFGGRAGIHEFTELRWVSVATAPRHYPF